ncbi:beta-glucosidase [Penicillium malachiteum]|uniref:beta-glucosidase n=1 Tax=Penicillium malachiteum TaxID=1324776 RepID=UPI002548EFD2|nr:beta-glucosidase [Penicillium malachiteum]KAJ5737858.1 beta-glucosidase [Penicillium malachiteum]
MTIPELVLQMHLMFADNIIGPNSDNALYDQAMEVAPGAPIGIMHDWYPTNKSQYNDLQKLNTEKSRLYVPFMQTGECLHGVGSFKQSMFPQAIAMAASFDTNLVHRVGRAIATEARSIGVHACFAPVLDLAKEPRWGRVQEDWGEDMVLTSHMGVAFASGLSKNSTWGDPDAVIPIMKHFAAHGSPQAGHNAAPFMGYGTREVLQEMLMPFKAAVDLGGVRGVMMAYSEFDDVPSSVNPLLYQALEDWGYDGIITADDAGLEMLLSTHLVTSSVADTIAQWHNAGGIIQYYDFPLSEYVDDTVALVSNGTLTLSQLQALAKRVLSVKYDLNLFENPYIAEDIDIQAITKSHVPLTLEAAQKAIVLLENNNSTLPLQPDKQGIKNIALIGPFADTLNYGDYSGQFGGYPVRNASTIREGLTKHLESNFPDTNLLTSWGANSWNYNGQYNIPPYLLSVNGTAGGLQATYYATTNFTDPTVQRIETPSLDWGLYPPNGLPSNNFSAIWEGDLEVPVETDTNGWIGVAVYANTSAKLYIDGKLHVDVPATTIGTILSDIPGLSFTEVNSTLPPEGSSSFQFGKNATHRIRLEYQAWNYVQKFENVNSLNAQVLLFWNLVDPVHSVDQAVGVAQKSDVVILALGANWNSDGESGDRATLGFSPNQTILADAIYSLGKPVVLVLQGGRPFAVPEYYNKSVAVLNTFFPGQSGGQAISDAIFGVINPGGRVPISVPFNAGALPSFYNYKPSFPRDYTDTQYLPLYPFGYGLSYTNFTTSNFSAAIKDSNRILSDGEFDAGSNITFSLTLTNSGNVAGSYVPQVYQLGRISSITRPVKQLVAFKRVYLAPGESQIVTMDVDVSRYLVILDRSYTWTVELGEYTFALLENGGSSADTSVNITLNCVE